MSLAVASAIVVGTLVDSSSDAALIPRVEAAPIPMPIPTVQGTANLDAPPIHTVQGTLDLESSRTSTVQGTADAWNDRAAAAPATHQLPLREVLDREHERLTAALERSTASRERIRRYQQQLQQKGSSQLMAVDLDHFGSPAELLRFIERDNKLTLAHSIVPSVSNVAERVAQHQSVTTGWSLMDSLQRENPTLGRRYTPDTLGDGRLRQIPKYPLKPWNEGVWESY